MKQVISFFILTLFISCAAPVVHKNEYQLSSLLYFQKASESKALFIQGYNFGKIRLLEILKTKPKRKLAVILDIDETVLDNSAFQATMLLENREFNPDLLWNWLKKGESKVLPGFLDFANFAVSNGVELFFISNRPLETLEGTILNFQREGIPFNRQNILLRTAERSKEARRQSVDKDYEIALLFGDNLIDFSDLYNKKSNEERDQAVRRQKELFGSKFIVMPNPMYGDWDEAFSNYKHLGSEEDLKNRYQNLIPTKID